MIPLDPARQKGLLITVACVRSLSFVRNPTLYARRHLSFKDEHRLKIVTFSVFCWFNMNMVEIEAQSAIEDEA